MSNVSDYLKWRGDLDFSQAPFNDVDNLILAQIAYVDFTDIVPAPGSIETITIAEAADTFFDTHDEKEIKKCKSFIGKAPYLLREAAATKRFGSLILTNYVDYVDGGKEEQFAAFHVRIDNRLTYIAFRGTDDTLVGWKEDFNMSFLSPVPSQKDAVRYIDTTVQRSEGKLILGGHSKGGNLAVYSAVKSDPSIRRRILDVYSHDGPGFLKSFFELPEYEQMKDRIHKTVPQSSLVGMLFETQEDYKVVKSRAFSLFQHDPASWVVNGNDFAYADHLNSGARHMDETLNTWILGLSPADRERFVDTLFELLNSTDVFSTEELVQNWSANLQILMQAARDLDPESREFLQRTIRDLFTISLKTIPDRFRKK